MRKRLILIIMLLFLSSGVFCSSCRDTPLVKEDTRISSTGTQVPDSEMTHLIFPLQWILENDEEPAPDSVKISFPASWLVINPVVSEDESPVELNVPKTLFDEINSSNNPEIVTVFFPNRYFDGLPEEPSTAITLPQLLTEPPVFHFFTRPGENPPDETLFLWSQQGDAEWILSCDAPWLKFSRTSGTARSLGKQPKIRVDIGIDASGLDEGTYSTIISAFNIQEGRTREIPVNLYVTNAYIGQIPDIDIITEQENTLKAEITFTRLGAQYESISRPISVARPDVAYDTGDYCAIVTGTVINNTRQDISVAIRAVGYDKEGNEISWSLQVDPYPISAGISIVKIPQGDTEDFKLYLSWSEDIELIKIFSEKYIESDIPAP